MSKLSRSVHQIKAPGVLIGALGVEFVMRQNLEAAVPLI
jgi:hypothetical protein